jgi:hypothetical protein
MEGGAGGSPETLRATAIGSPVLSCDMSRVLRGKPRIARDDERDENEVRRQNVLI